MTINIIFILLSIVSIFLNIFLYFLINKHKNSYNNLINKFKEFQLNTVLFNKDDFEKSKNEIFELNEKIIEITNKYNVEKDILIKEKKELNEKIITLEQKILNIVDINLNKLNDLEKKKNEEIKQIKIDKDNEINRLISEKYLQNNKNINTNNDEKIKSEIISLKNNINIVFDNTKNITNKINDYVSNFSSLF